jgi:hypothetical protein
MDSLIRGHQFLRLVAASQEDTMRTVILSILAIMLMLRMASCDRDADAVRQMQIQAEQRKQQLMQQIQPTLLIGAIMVMLVTFYGDVIAERFREKLVAELGLTPARQAMLLTAGYLLICSVLAGWSMARCGIAWAMPFSLISPASPSGSGISGVSGNGMNGSIQNWTGWTIRNRQTSPKKCLAKADKAEAGVGDSAPAFFNIPFTRRGPKS